MSVKYIPSKKAYFNRPGNDMTEAEWEAFKQANPQPEYTGEICWRLHDSMLARNKAKDDSKIVKTLLKELDISYDKTSKGLKITSDLTSKDIVVVEIEDDNLLIQLEQAGARVLYITSNVNYSWRAPERYFDMYNEATYDATDYPATNKRNLFNGKNIIVKYINFFDYKKGLYYNELYNIIKENNMIINKVLMNPPFDGSLHLEITEATIKAVRASNKDAEIVSIQPCDWLENALTEYKTGEYKKFFTTNLVSMTKLQPVNLMDAQKAFNIGTDVDLGIYTYKPNCTKFDVSTIRQDVANKVFIKVLTKLENMRSLNDVLDEKVVDGWRVKLNEMRPQSGGTNPNTTGYSARTWGIQLVSSTEAGINECVFKDGYNEEGIYWTNVRSKNQFGKNDGATFRHSIETADKETALNIAESCNTNFYRNWIYLIKFNQHMPLRFLPYMEDYSHVWTDEDYCKFFELTEEETAFMCRKIDDYRIKDFINYIDLKDEN